VLNCTIKHSWLADVTGRVGVVALDRALIYLKGGVAWEEASFSVGNTLTFAGTSFTMNASGSGTQTGGLLGMGMEYGFLTHWSAKIEYNFIDFGNRSFSAPISATPPLAGMPLAGLNAIPVTTTENQHIIKAGVNWYW